MQGGGRGRDSFFGSSDPFAGFGGFGGFGGHGSLLSDFFRGRDPFDDPFFTRPFGSMFGGNLSGSMFESGFFGPGGSLFPNVPPVGFIENQQPQPEPQPNTHRGPIIEEINSDDENKEDADFGDGIPIKHSRLEKDPFVQYPDDAADERKSKHVQFRNEYHKMRNMPPELQHSMNCMAAQPQSQCFSFQSSSVTYGGADGAYYTKSTTKRTGSDGVMFEEHKEADSSTGQATHLVSRGLQKKGHTLTRKLNSDGRVDSMQTLHNLNEDELTGFEEAWKGNAKKRLPGLNNRFNRFGSSTNGEGGEQTGRRKWALPSLEHPLPQQNGRRAWSHLDLNATAPKPPQNSGSGHPINGTHGKMRT